MKSVTSCSKFKVQRVYLVGNGDKIFLLLGHGKYRPYKFYIIQYGIKKWNLIIIFKKIKFFIKNYVQIRLNAI